MKKVGVLSLQGDFAAHGAALERAGAEPVYVREREQLERIAGLIIPGTGNPLGLRQKVSVSCFGSR